MMSLRVAFLALLYILSGAPVSANTPNEQALVVSLLTHPEAEQFRFGAKAVSSMALHSESVLDVVAERMLQESRQLTPQSLDPVAWLARALGESRNGRYRDVLADVLNESRDKKLSKYLVLALKQIPRTDAAAYVPGTLSLADARQAALNHLQNIATTEANPRIDGVEAGLSLDAVLARFGAPDVVDTTRSAVKVPMPGSFTAFTIQLLYYGRGAVRLDNRNEWRSLYGTREMHPVPKGLDGADALIAHNLMLPGGDALNLMIRRIGNRRPFPPLLLDVMANRLWLSRISAGSEADGLELICRYLAESKDGRYRPLLDFIAQHALDHSLKDEAEDFAERLPLNVPSHWTQVIETGVLP